jgi:hypothetical protein
VGRPEDGYCMYRIEPAAPPALRIYIQSHIPITNNHIDSPPSQVALPDGHGALGLPIFQDLMGRRFAYQIGNIVVDIYILYIYVYAAGLCTCMHACALCGVQFTQMPAIF